MVQIAFLGDISFNDEYNSLYANNVDPFIDVKNILGGNDLVVGNLECTAKGKKGVNLLKKPRLSTEPETLNYLGSLNGGLISLATNHVYDNLEDGFQKTVSFLESNNIDFLGCSTSKDESVRTVRKNIKGLDFCFLNYVTEDTNPSLPPGAQIFPSIFSEDQCFTDLNANSDADFRVVLIHWGGKYEGGLFPAPEQYLLAKKIFENGADLIIGHHSHTFQPYEVINGKQVFYSLGNFCFADIVSDGKIRPMSTKRLRQSGIVQIEFQKGKYKSRVIPIENQNLKIRIKPSVSLRFGFRNNIFKVMKLIKPFWILYMLYFRYLRPVLVGVFRVDKEKNLLQRIREFRLSKLKGGYKK